MRVFRITRSKYARELSGKGASISGGRWNLPGTELVYTSENRSLAMAEVAVHLSLGTLPDDYVILTIDIPEKLRILRADEEILPEGWRAFPFPSSARHFGEALIRSHFYPVYSFPSAVTPGDFNFLLNPLHPDFQKIRIIKTEPFPFDKRLLK